MSDSVITLDRFQIEAIAALDRGHSVLVSAPTGSGKTRIAEHAVDLARGDRRRVFYTTPIKALSNQKFHDLRALHGDPAVGLLTGDTSINGDAPVVVMTTEVLRNMIYARSSSLDDLDWVVLDEVHYLQDSARGSVWEEVIIHLPAHVRLVCLSATVSNADELGEWISVVRGPIDVITEDRRPVTLDNWYLVDDRHRHELALLPTLVDGRSSPDGHRFDLAPHERVRGARRRYATPGRVEVVELLAERSMLPAIHFIFSRSGCDDAVVACVRSGLRFTDDDERLRIREIAERHVRELSDGDLRVLGYGEWLEALERGIASHHAGLVPPFKEAVEECFVAGAVRIVFATETLALGVNMPARTVVIDKLTKYTGERHEPLTPAQYTQLTGRAGRRGIDDHGNAVVLWSPFVPFDEVATLAASRSFRLTSSFRPTYNMAANLVRRYDAADAHRLLGLSFAQFQMDTVLSREERRLESRRRELTEATAAARCSRGDVDEYAALVERSRRPAAAGSGGAAVESALRDLRPGDVFARPGSRRHGLVAVLSVSTRRDGAVRVKVLDARGVVSPCGAQDLDRPPEVLGRLDLPVPYKPTNSRFQRSVAAGLDRFAADARRASGSRTTVDPRREAERLVNEHPVHDCPDRDTHLRALRDRQRLQVEVDRTSARLRDRTESLVDQFDRLLQLLEAWGHLDGWALTAKGDRLVRLYHECDLVIAEAIDAGLLDGVDAPSLAGLLSAFIYESRPSGPRLVEWFPSAEVKRRAMEIDALALTVAADERRVGLPATRRPDFGFFALAHAWASGRDLERLLADDLPGGDFVRTIKQLLDLLRQVADTDAPCAAVAAEAAVAMQRGVVLASGTGREVA